jgi:hypothetical protein
MEFPDALHEIARTLVDAFDVDIQLWMGKAFRSLRETRAGVSFAQWAETNPIAFQTLLRVTSAAVRRLPQDSNLLIETIYTQLSRLPVEVKRAVEADDTEFSFSIEENDSEFFAKYEEALKDLSDEELAEVVKLDQHRLREWANSPVRIRPHLLKKWVTEESEGQERRQHAQSSISSIRNAQSSFLDSVKSVPKKLDSGAEKLAPSLGKVVDWLEAHGGKPKKKA